MQVIAYIRVSTKDQEKRGSHEIQIQAIENYCQKQNYQLINQYIDAGEHGWDMERVEFKKMLTHLQQSEVEALIIQHSDRFSRGDPIDTLVIYKHIFETGKKVYSLLEGELSLDSLEQFLLMSIKTFTNANRIQVDKAKQKAGILRYREKHKRWGRKEKHVNWKKYDEYVALGLPKTNIAKLMGMSIPTLYKRLKERTQEE